ncbi:Putative adhesin [Seinonella peptonophila]|uniref:Putative adhesin n=1 Tax=Seinonella peptonophila TaxID=112248 RepID=A0A1M4X8R6_9BACL|nr:DUF4097 family beta strand repeat-containing protein [Seinonella peptonophila]SHE89795.1 Putative adhesin [Seinonella peptonophila]
MNLKTKKAIIVAGLILIVGSIILYIQNDDWLLQRKRSVKITKTKDVKQISSIAISGDHTNITLHQSDTDQLTVQMQGQVPVRDQPDLHMKIDDQELSIILKMKWGSNPFSFKRNFSTRLKVFLPKKVYQSIQLSAVEGDIDTTDLPLQSHRIELESKQGKIDASHMKTDTLITESTIKTQLKQIEANGIWIKTVSGGLKIRNNQEKETPDHQMKIENIGSSGDKVRLSGLQGVDQEVSVVSDTGLDLDFHLIKARLLHLTTFSGKLTIDDFQGYQLTGDLNGTKATIKNLNAQVILKGESTLTVDPMLISQGDHQLTFEDGDVHVKFRDMPTNLFVALQTEEGQIKSNLPIRIDHSLTKKSVYDRSIVGDVRRDPSKPYGQLLIHTRKGNIQVDAK